jgi:phosphoglycolate phosphatase
MLRAVVIASVIQMKKQIIFDLDGTLIDSAPSILDSFKQAFSTLDIKPSVPITPDVVGPPLMPTLTKLAGQDDPELLKNLAAQFKAHYDTEGYKEAAVFEGVPALLETLQQADVSLYIATNKRDFPTQKIMQYLNWSPYFKGVFALDSYTPPLASKPQMVARILADYAIHPTDAIYIGDRYEDGIAADENDIQFAMVTWGYADKASTTLKPDWLECQDIATLEKLLVC